tara:strand:+ start:62 stop:592 length:531 start_codon:yes stop_codon:yes gene_type:complete
MNRLLPLVLAGCVSHNVNLEGTNYDNPEAFLLRSTSELTYELRNGVVGYSRKGNIFLIEGKDGFGYYRDGGEGLKIPPGSEREIVTYNFDGTTLKFTSNDGSCRESYVFDLNDEENNRISLSEPCDLWSSLGERIESFGSLSFKVLSEDERDMVSARLDDLMVQEAKVALSYQDGQ